MIARVTSLLLLLLLMIDDSSYIFWCAHDMTSAPPGHPPRDTTWAPCARGTVFLRNGVPYRGDTPTNTDADNNIESGQSVLTPAPLQDTDSGRTK